MIDTVIISGGNIQNGFALDFLKKRIKEGGRESLALVAADSGMEWFMRNREFIPDLAVGDFDSLSEEGKKYMESLNGLKIIRLKPEKDDSDTQSAVNHMISEGSREILIFGATGTRLDHVLANLGLLSMGREKGVHIALADQWNYITLVDSGTVLKKEEQKKTWRCLLPHFLLWCVLNTCCLILIRTKGVLSLFSAAVAAIILLFETIFAFQKEEAWKEKTRRREYMTSRQLQYYAKQYEALSHFQETMRKERHERKNRNMELLMLAQKGDFDSLICRLNEEQSLMTPHSSTTGNRTVDAVLDFEKAVAREKKIEVEESISIPREMEVADSVLCSVLGNALDNAIEACDRVSEKERLVKIFMKVERKNLFIEIKNRYDGTIFKAQDGRLISRKENPQEHGMGLRIMHELLEHADGNVETMWDEHVFTLRVMIYHVI